MAILRTLIRHETLVAFRPPRVAWFQEKSNSLPSLVLVETSCGLDITKNCALRHTRGINRGNIFVYLEEMYLPESGYNGLTFGP